MKLRLFPYSLIMLFFLTIFSTSKSIELTTPLIKELQETFEKQVDNFNFFINYKPNTFFEQIYEALRYSSTNTGIDLSWPLVSLATNDKLYILKGSMRLKLAFNKLKLAEYMITKSCLNASNQSECSSQDKELILSQESSSLMGRFWYSMIKGADFLGISSLHRLLFNFCPSFYVTINLYKTTHSPNFLLATKHLGLKASVAFIFSLIGSVGFLELMEQLDKYDGGGISSELARLNLERAKKNFQDALVEINKHNEKLAKLNIK